MSQTKRGFTLIELLVVIAIVAILGAIIFSVTGPARENARRTNCLSNLRQIGMAVRMYCDDYESDSAEQTCYTLGFPPHLFILTAKSPSSGRGYLSGNDDVLHCPDMDEDLKANAGPEDRWCSYNYLIWGRNSRNVPPGFPTFGEAVAKRNDALPILADIHHDFPPLDRPVNDRFVLIYRLGGNVSSKRVPRSDVSWKW